MKRPHPLPSGCLLIFVILFFGPSFLFSQSRNNSKAEISRLEDRWLQAIDAVDIAALNQILADDFLRPAPASGQFITKAQMLNYYRSRKHSATSASKRIENLSVTVYGNAAIARGMVVSRDASGHVLSKNLFTDVFLNRDARWQAVSAQENDLDARSN